MSEDILQALNKIINRLDLLLKHMGVGHPIDEIGMVPSAEVHCVRCGESTGWRPVETSSLRIVCRKCWDEELDCVRLGHVKFEPRIKAIE